jgi:hypothetical protein
MDEASRPTILYCHCQYAQVVPKEVKEAVLRKLCDSATPFEAVADLCEMSARKDPALARIAASGAVKIAACYPRAVKWLFAAANAPLPIDSAEVVNMRTMPGEAVCEALLHSPLQPNLPAGKVTLSVAELPAAAGMDAPAPITPPAVEAPAA